MTLWHDPWSWNMPKVAQKSAKVCPNWPKCAKKCENMQKRCQKLTKYDISLWKWPKDYESGQKLLKRYQRWQNGQNGQNMPKVAKMWWHDDVMTWWHDDMMTWSYVFCLMYTGLNASNSKLRPTHLLTRVKSRDASASKKFQPQFSS